MSATFNQLVCSAMQMRKKFVGLQGIDGVKELDIELSTLYKQIGCSWRNNANDNAHIGRITSDGAALITFALAPCEVPIHPPNTSGERLVEYLLRYEATGHDPFNQTKCQWCGNVTAQEHSLG